MRRPRSALASVVGMACLGMACLAAACGGQAPAGGAGEYPVLYRKLQLPILPGGEVEDTGRQTTSLRDGLSLRVMSADMSVDEVREYYRTQLAASGWDELPSRTMPGMAMAGVQATKDGVTFMAIITADPDRTRIQLTVTER